MTHPLDKQYLLYDPAHWRAGALDNLEPSGDGLRVPADLCAEPVEGTTTMDAGARPAADACGRLIWLRPCDGTLVRRYEFGPQEVGRLHGADNARKLVAGNSVLWVLGQQTGEPPTVRRYDAAGLQLIGHVRASVGHQITSIASDGSDGLWILETADNGEARLRHVDCWQRSCCRSWQLDRRLSETAQIGATPDGQTVVIVNPLPDEPPSKCEPSAKWQLIIAAPCEPAIHHTLDIRGSEKSKPVGDFAVDADHRIHVLVQDAALTLQTFTINGERIRQQPLSGAARIGIPSLHAAGGQLLLSGATGLVELVPCAAGQVEGDEQHATFISPTLVSPPGVRSGWNRADIDIELPAGTTLEIAYAATSVATTISQVDAVFANTNLSPLDRFAELNGLLNWREAETVSFGGSDQSGIERLRALLDTIEETHLWLRLSLFTPPGRMPPTLHRLRVLYPRRSYIEDLPAIYREDPTAAAQLRRMLAPLESVFGDIDDQIAELPERIDPHTAPDTWTGFLLSWLGFPPVTDLSADLRRELLLNAPDLLKTRGTLHGLRTMLDIVTTNRASIEELATQPAGWFLPRPENSVGTAKLGVDTLVTSQQPAGFRVGQGAILGDSPLGNGCADPIEILCQRAGLIIIRIEIDQQERNALEPIIDRLLRIFVPAHCRMQVIYMATDGRWRARQLDVDFRLPAETDDSAMDGYLFSDAHWRLGVTTALGTWHLPIPGNRPVVLNSSSAFDNSLRLA